MKQQDSSLRSEQESLGQTILKKLSTIEDLLKRSRQAGMPSAKDDHAYRQTSKPLTFKEACAYLGYAPSYLYKLTYKNIVPHYKPTGKIIFFSKNELDEWIFNSSVERRVMSDELRDEKKTEKDPNSPRFAGEAGQIEMELEEKMERSKKEMNESEVVIEFPLKSRRRS